MYFTHLLGKGNFHSSFLILNSSFITIFYIYNTLGSSNSLVLFEPLMRMVMF